MYTSNRDPKFNTSNIGTYFYVYTVNDRLSAAALNKVLRFLSAALIQLRRLFRRLLRTLKLFSVTRAR